uniref:Major facilitator superfamily (MFS) profile domain-containing protein n=1 Tax=Strigamia maritima TaxID=126957 RepID=T1JCF8_STRMM
MPSNEQIIEDDSGWKKKDKPNGLIHVPSNDKDAFLPSPPEGVKWELHTPDHEDDKTIQYFNFTLDELNTGNKKGRLSQEKVIFANGLTVHDSNHKLNGKLCQEQDGSWQLVAPDGGWGWMVLLGTVIVNSVLSGLLKSFGILFLEFLNVFHASPYSAAWIPGLTFALYNLLGPLASALSNRFSCRFITVIGGLCTAVGLGLSYFATSIDYLYISYGLLGGIGAGLSYTPGILIVGQYFEKRRGFANGICMSGSALGSIILPPLLYFLLSIYGYKGAILIMSGVLLNVCVGAALYQPVEWHQKLEWVPTVASEDKFGDDVNTSSKKMPSSGPLKERKVSWLPLGLPEECEEQPKPMLFSENRLADGEKVMEEKEKGRNTIPEVREVLMNFGSRSTIGGTAERLRRTMSAASTLSSSSFAYMSTMHLGSTAAAYQCTDVGQMGKREPRKQILGWCNRLAKLFDIKLLSNTVFLLITYSCATSGIGYTNLLIILPAYAHSLGIHQAEYAILLSIIASTDLTGRVSGAWVSDIGLFPRKYFFIIGLTLSGVVLGCMPLAKDFTQLAIACAFFGLTSGVYIGLMAVLLMDHLGQERLASSFGLCLAVNGIVMLAGPPTVGIIRQQIGSYQPVLWILGIILITGGAVWILEPFATRYEVRKEELKACSLV